MAKISDFTASSADWREQLRQNEKRTKFIILIFVLLYLALGFLIDLLLNSGQSIDTYGREIIVPLGQAALELLTFKVTPYATLTMVVVAIISLFITYVMHDKIILLGTDSHEVKSSPSDLQEKTLYNVVEEMKVAASLRYMPKIYIIEANYMNAFASGYSEKSALVAITRGLLNKLDRSELQAVMAHELSHIRHHDIKLTLTASVLSNIMLIVIDVLFWKMILSRSRRENNNRIVFIIMILRYVLPIITVLLMLYLSRTREYMADAGSVELMRDNGPMAKALIKIHEDYQTNQEAYQQELARTAHEQVRRAAYIYDPGKMAAAKGNALSVTYSTHPSLEQRLAALGYKQTSE